MDEKTQKHHVNVDYFEDLTGDIDHAEGDDPGAIGERIKSIRQEKGLSLETMSKMTGFPEDVLSSIEKKEIQPQLGTVIKLSKALDSAFSRVISGLGSRLYSITRKEEQKKVSRSTSHKGKKELYTYRSLAPEVKGRHMEALKVTLDENPEEETSIHDGEEFIYVIQGQVMIKIGDEKFELSPGDSIYYLSTTPHMVAAKNKSAEILAILYGG